MSELLASLCRDVLRSTCLVLLVAATPARADVDADRAAISHRLERWAAAFNARDVAGTCDLFAPDLIATVRGAPDRSRDAVCQQLASALARPDQQLRYTPDIQEIIVAGDVAVVRLIWRLTVGRGSQQHTGEERGIDIFRRQGDGMWSIIRFIAFSSDPD